jgi:glycosyltransferase involved in cell wall biosynthesis
MSKKFISIVIPSLNQGKFISRCFESILEQKFESYEIILVDAFSTDSTNNIVKKYKKIFKEKLIYKKKKTGQAEALNYGFSKASGKFIAWQNCDDYYLKGAFNKFYNFAKKNPNANLIFGNLEFRNKKNKLIRPLNFNFVNKFSLCYEGMTVSNQSLIMKNKVFKKFGNFSEVKQSFDLEYFIRISSEKYFKLDSEEPIAAFTVHRNQKSNFYSKYDTELRSFMIDYYRRSSFFYYLPKFFFTSVSRFARFLIHLKKLQFSYIFLYFTSMHKITKKTNV